MLMRMGELDSRHDVESNSRDGALLWTGRARLDSTSAMAEGWLRRGETVLENLEEDNIQHDLKTALKMTLK